MRIVVSLLVCIMYCSTHLRMSRSMCSCAFVWSCGMYAVITMIEVPSYGVSLAAFMWSMWFVGVCMGVASLYTSLRVAKIVPADLLSVLGSSFGGVCITSL